VVHFLGLWLSRRHHIPWIADFRDPWAHDGLGRPRRWIDRWFEVCERSVYRHASRVLANAPNALEAYRRQYPREAYKLRLLTNGYDPRAAASAAPPRADGVVRLVHAGEIYLGRDPRPLFDAMRDLGARPPLPGVRVELHILGRADVDRAEIERAIRERGLADSVVFRGQVSYQESLDAMAAADINVLFDTPNRRFGVPAKLYEYFGAQRPILALTEADGDAAGILRECGLVHRVAHPRRAADIRDALADLMLAAARGTPAVTDPARLVQFTRERLTAVLAGIMDEVLGEREAGHGD
jgi:glycosyltransferase involved in cell wall biosynthesis